MTTVKISGATAPAPDDEDEADYIPRHTEGRELKSTCNLL